MPELLKTTRGQIIVALLASAFVVTLAVVTDMTFGIGPVLLAVMWVPIISRPRSRLARCVLTVGLLALVALGVLIYGLTAG